jgi:hypothetical protein
LYGYFVEGHILKQLLIKRKRIQKGQSKMDNSEKLATNDTQDKQKQTKTHTIEHHYTQANTNNVNKT